MFKVQLSHQKNGLKFSISMMDISSLPFQVQKKDVNEKDSQKIGGFLFFCFSTSDGAPFSPSQLECVGPENEVATSLTVWK